MQRSRYPNVTKLKNEIKQLKLEKDKLIKDVYEKYSIIKALTDTAASIEEIGSQTEYVN